MRNSSSPIGVIDTGVGGLTVAYEIKRLYPNEEILYFGDSANCPYGNRSGDEIISLTKNMLDFLAENNVKAVAIACNTISTQVDTLTGYPFPIVGIVAPAAKMVAALPVKKVGVVATAFTIFTGEYNRLINLANPSIEVIGLPSGNLAALVDSGDFDLTAIDNEIVTSLTPMLTKDKPTHVILGCTHYPIVLDRFQKCFPDVTFVNPAVDQARELAELLKGENMLCTEQREGKFIYCSSSDSTSALNIIKRIGMQAPDEVRCVRV